MQLLDPRKTKELSATTRLEEQTFVQQGGGALALLDAGGIPAIAPSGESTEGGPGTLRQNTTKRSEAMMLDDSKLLSTLLCRSIIRIVARFSCSSSDLQATVSGSPPFLVLTPRLLHESFSVEKKKRFSFYVQSST